MLLQNKIGCNHRKLYSQNKNKIDRNHCKLCSHTRSSVSMRLTVSRQKAKNFTVNRQRKELSLAVKRFQGLSNLTTSAFHVGLLVLK